MYPLAQCFYLLADSDEVDQELRAGSYLCSRGWLSDWRRHLRVLGLDDPAMARDLFADSVQRVLLLDTGEEPSLLGELEAFAAHVDRPFARKPIGLGYLRLQLTNISARAELHQLRAQTFGKVADAQRKAADAAMAMDLLGQLSNAKDQHDVVERMLDIFRALFAPKRLFYVRLDVDAGSDKETIGLSDQIPLSDDELRRACEFGQGAAVTADTASAAGFMLKLQHDQVPLGVFVLDELALPAYRLEYQNLALQMLGLCALAMERAEALAKLSRSEARYRNLFSAMQEGFVVHEVRESADGLGVEYCFLDVNPAFERLAGVERDRLVGHCLSQVAPAICEVYLERCAELVRSGQPVHFEVESESLGKAFDVYAYRPMPGSFAVILADISARREAEAHVRYLAHYDSLSGLPNRALLEQRAAVALDKMAEQKQPLALLFCDLDRFKPINDQYGHAAGDGVLKEAARRFCMAVRQTDTVSRLGGDEFVLLLPRAGRSSALGVAHKLLEVMAEPMAIEGESLSIGLSIGISLYPAHGADFEGLSRLADIALYAAKRQGRGCARVYESGMAADLVRERG